jgi:hypothetical protein
MVFDVAYNSVWDQWLGLGIVLPYDEQVCTFVFGDTPISAKTNAVTALAGAPFSNVVLAQFTNGVAGSAATNFNAVINWGDNTLDNGVVTADANGQKAVLGSHTYGYAGAYPVYVEIQSTIGASATVLSFVTVTNGVPPVNPVLELQFVSAQQLMITWPTNDAGFHLEENAVLGTSNWVASTNSVSVVGTEYQVTVPTSERARFYRLKQP